MENKFALMGGRDGENFHRAVIGRFQTESEATAEGMRLSAEGRIDWWLVTDQASGRVLESPTSGALDQPTPDLDTVPMLPYAPPESSVPSTCS